MTMATDCVPTAEKTQHKLRWYQYSLRSLFVLTLVVAVACSWLTVTMRDQRKQKAAAEAIEKAGGEVQLEPTWLGRILRDDSLVNATWVDLDGRYCIVDCQSALVHLEGLRQAKSLFLSHSNVTDAGLVPFHEASRLQQLEFTLTQVTDVGLAHLQGLRQLQHLVLAGTKVTDAGLVHLEGLRQLCDLDLIHTNVTDAGLLHLHALTRLQVLDLSGTKVTDAGLVHLQRLSQLQYLWLNNTKVTDQGVKKLQRTLPNCQIKR